MLMNIFDRSEVGSSGASVFLSTRILLELCQRNERMPRAARARVRQLLQGPHRDGDYDELYELLHDPKHAWTLDLERAMRARQVRIKLGRGQGYLIHDRTWLHGRLPVATMVPSFRLHRLVFMTRATQVG